MACADARLVGGLSRWDAQVGGWKAYCTECGTYPPIHLSIPRVHSVEVDIATYRTASVLAICAMHLCNDFGSIGQSLPGTYAVLTYHRPDGTRNLEKRQATSFVLASSSRDSESLVWREDPPLPRNPLSRVTLCLPSLPLPLGSQNRQSASSCWRGHVDVMASHTLMFAG